MAKKVTIYDIADRLNLSPSTVSRALAGNSLISIDTRDRIRKAAEEMGYRSSSQAPRTEADTIAVVVPEINNIFYSNIIRSIQDKLQPRYLLSIICSDNSARKERDIVSRLNPSHIKCLIISQSMDVEDNSHLKEAEKKGIIVILFNRIYYNNGNPKFLVDNYMDSYLLTRHLASTGCRRIAFAAKHYNCPIYKDRIRAYKDVLKENGQEFEQELLIYSELTMEDTTEVISRFLRTTPRPDALIMPNFVSALQAISAARLLNLSVPQDIAIVSFDDNPECKFSSPSITGISRPHEEMGEEIAAAALALCEGAILESGTIKVFSSRLVIRGSSFSC